MILSNIVIGDLKEKSGLLFDQAKDFDMLAKFIGRNAAFHRCNYSQTINGLYR